MAGRSLIEELDRVGTRDFSVCRVYLVLVGVLRLRLRSMYGAWESWVIRRPGLEREQARLGDVRVVDWAV